MKRLFGAGLALLLMGHATPPPGPDLEWMSGRWESSAGQGRWTEENWSTPIGGVMLGYSRSGVRDTLREFEFLRIQLNDDGFPVYFAQPGGRPPVAFRQTARDGTSVTFENPANDFPQRIVYRRTGDTMVATISKLDGSNAMSWTFRRR
ncbi:MAG TPA: DUF6265 family protein [Allosphingosinicella sp.]|nr:DUF6265 family protein [Allosphingosinicella sp.]